MNSPRNLAAVLALFLLAASAVRGAPEPPQTSEEPAPHAGHPMGHQLIRKGIPNFGEVTPSLYRGGQPDERGWAALSKMDIKVVIDTHASSKREKKTVNHLGMKYVSIPWHCPWPKDAVFAKFLKVLRENHGKKVFVHCRLGDDRTGMMVAAYRMADEGWTAEEAMNEMQTFGFSRAHHFICPSLAGYERKFPERLKNSPEFEELRSKGTGKSEK